MQLIEHRYNLNVVLLERASKRPQLYFSGVSGGQDILEKNLTFIEYLFPFRVAAHTIRYIY